MSNRKEGVMSLGATLNLSERGIAIPIQKNPSQFLVSGRAEIREVVFRIGDDHENPARGRPATTSASSPMANDERRSQAGPGSGNGGVFSDVAHSTAGHSHSPEGNGGVAPEVAPDNGQNINSYNKVADVADNVQTGPQFRPKSQLAVLLDDVVDVICGYVSLRKDQKYAELVALWIAGTHVFSSSTTFPRFVVTSPEPSCGKSTLLKIMSCLCPNASFHARATEPSILRRIKTAKEKKSPISIFLDDAENFVNASHTSFLNSGFDRFGGTLLRCRIGKGGNYQDDEFDVYVPIAVGRIGRTPIDSTHTRCIEVNVQRAKPGEVTHRIDLETPKLLRP